MNGIVEVQLVSLSGNEPARYIAKHGSDLVVADTIERVVDEFSNVYSVTLRKLNGESYNNPLVDYYKIISK